MIDQLLTAGHAELDARMRGGHPIEPDALAGADYDGISLGLPRLVDRLLWKKFRKSFRRDAGGPVGGWNVRMVQNRLDEPWVAQERGGQPVTFGRFVVVRAADGTLVLDYSVERSPLLRPLRDPLVALVPGDPTWLLGRSRLALAGLDLPTPAYFLLRRA